MPKHKPKRSNPTIDMTAMCDVSFLLLTFFILTAKARPAESVIVDTPSSISQTKLPDAGTLTLLVSKEGKVFLDMVGQHTRKYLIDEMNNDYSLGLTDEEKLKFSIAGGFGVPRAGLKKWLDASPTERNEMDESGIPIDTVDVNKSELATWIHRARLAQFEMKKQGVVSDEYVIVLKADKDTPYPAVKRVINTLTDINVNKFNLITTMEGDPNKLNAIEGK
ncbi:MAG: biopolymer transporter ExbD [Lewinellaceae bacterium]|nr:biopolymer transporter ExbD [Lewinellaceae bacterium]